MDSRTCRIDLHAQPYPDRRPPSGSQGGGCRCRCRGADTGLRIGSSAARSRSRTWGSSIGWECSCPRIRGGWGLDGSCGPPRRRGRRRRCLPWRKTGWRLGGAACLPRASAPASHSLVCGGSPSFYQRQSYSSVCRGPSRRRWWPAFAARCSSECRAPSRDSAQSAGRDVPFSASSRVTSKAGGCGSGARSGSCRGGWGTSFSTSAAPTRAPRRPLLILRHPLFLNHRALWSERVCVCAHREAPGGTPDPPRG